MPRLKTLRNHQANGYGGVYNLHKYWSKKPPNIIRNLILENSLKNDLILDPFSGSGISILESVALKRRVIGIDINPVSIFITRQLLAKIDIANLKKNFHVIREKTKSKIEELYTATRAGHDIIGTHHIWNNGSLKEIWFRNGTLKLTKQKATKKDKARAAMYSYDSIDFFFPKNRLFQNSRINVGDNDRINELFTPRNLFALSILYNEINKIKKHTVREVLKFCFTSSLGQASKMVFVINKKIDKTNGEKVNRNTKSVGSWVIGYWKPKEHFEINVWSCFERKFDKIVRAKVDQLLSFPFSEEVSSLKNILRSETGFSLFNEPAQFLLKKIPDNSIDYIITDPPHGDRIPYLELSQLWNSWLRCKVNYKDEIVISGSKERQKSLDEYGQLLENTFMEAYRVLKPGRNFTLMFNSLDDQTWMTIIQSLSRIGFKLKKIETLNYSSPSVVQNNRETSLKTDFVLTYKKISNPIAEIHLLNGEEGQMVLSGLINEIFNKDSTLKKYEILNKLFFHLLKRNQFFSLSQAIKLINSKSTKDLNPTFSED